MSPRPVIVWFLCDLRLEDHPALAAAFATKAPLVLVYILDEDLGGRWKRGSASRWWLAKSLAALAQDISDRGGKLILRRGETVEELARLAKETDAAAIHYSRAYEPWALTLDKKLQETFAKTGVALHRFGGVLLRQPEEIRTGSGQSYQVFTPFWRAFRAGFEPSRAMARPTSLDRAKTDLKSEKLAQWDLLPTKPDWSGGLAEAWEPGEAGAKKSLKVFLARGLDGYHRRRDAISEAGTSRLSPHLSFGEISPAACWRAATHAGETGGASVKSVEVFLRELTWREFSHSLLLRHPGMPDEPLRAPFAKFAWSRKTSDLKAWQKGLTGYPIVDAGMRELWTTGYMHNRVRMITASFLTKHLLLSWQQGEAWFWDTLVDANLANNATNWQWVAGSGADASPYFRIFNPVLQGKKFDPEGDYIRRWVGELARLPADAIHAPWEAEEKTLNRAGVQIGVSYPSPIVDHKAARARALGAYANLKQADA
jgi:deoxyribodipyrimidine photo-lyase